MGLTKNEVPEVTYGFIGIGDMGCPMSWNLRKKISLQFKLIVCDIKPENVEKLLAKCKGLGPVEVVSTPKEITEHCVCCPIFKEVSSLAGCG